VIAIRIVVGTVELEQRFVKVDSLLAALGQAVQRNDGTLVIFDMFHNLGRFVELLVAAGAGQVSNSVILERVVLLPLLS
jgi:hypothetical protein